MKNLLKVIALLMEFKQLDLMESTIKEINQTTPLSMSQPIKFNKSPEKSRLQEWSQILWEKDSADERWTNWTRIRVISEESGLIMLSLR